MMIKSQKFIAKTVEEAKKMAADAFGVPMSDIRFEVIEEPKRGLFGIGFKGNATVQATYESIDVSTVDRKAVEVTAKPVEEPASPAADPEPVKQPSVLEEVFNEAANAVGNAVKEVAPIVEDAVREVAPMVEDAVKEVSPIVEDAVSEVAPIVKDAVSEVAPLVKDAVSEVAPLVEDAVSEVAPIVENAVSEVTPVLEDAAREVSEEITKKPAKAAAPAAEDASAPLQQDEELITGEPSPASLEKIEKAKAYLLSILKEMEVEAELVVNAGADSAMINIVSQNSGTVIGKRGETLDALQYLTFMIANRGDKEYYRIILNSANYRERRRKTLEDLAAKIAKNVLRSGRQTTLEPMNPYERRIIHSAIAEIEGVSSRSVGEEPYRKVIISCVNRPARRPNGGRRFDRNDRNDRGDRNDRRSGGRGDRRNNRGDRDRRRGNESIPSERISMDSMKTSFEKDYKRPKADDEINAGLYGKIEF